MQLMLATETRPEIVEQIRKVKDMIVPYTWTFKNNPGIAESQTVTVRLNAMHGLYCKRIYHALYNNTEEKSTMYDHNNIGADTANAAMVKTYRTALDNSVRQEADLKAAIDEGDDYQLMKRYLKGSVIQNQYMHSFNWTHIDDFVGSPSMSDGGLPVNYLGGMELSNADRKWEFQGTSLVNAQYNHYTFVVCTRKVDWAAGAITIK